MAAVCKRCRAGGRETRTPAAAAAIINDAPSAKSPAIDSRLHCRRRRSAFAVMRNLWPQMINQSILYGDVEDICSDRPLKRREANEKQ